MVGKAILRISQKRFRTRDDCTLFYLFNEMGSLDKMAFKPFTYIKAGWKKEIRDKKKKERKQEKEKKK